MSEKWVEFIQPNNEKSILVYCILLKLVLVLFPMEYGYFRDELYLIALSDNLDWGYVDMPPLVPWLLAGVRAIFGTSLLTLHVLSGALGVIVLIITSQIIRQMGGNLFAYTLTLLCVAVAPLGTVMGSFLTYDGMDHVMWAGVLYTFVALLVTQNRKCWIYLGLIAGFGLLTKLTILWLGFGLVLAVVLTSERKHMGSPFFWIGGFLALLVASPYLFWQYQHDFPTLEFFSNYASGKTYPATGLEFLKNQIITMNPIAFPVWALGLYYFLFHPEGKRFRVLGIAYLIIFALCILQQAKFYLIAPFYPVLFAGGAIFVAHLFKRWNRLWPKLLLLALVCLGGLGPVPMIRPILPIETYVAYIGSSGDLGVKQETHSLNNLPQFLADRFGWEEMAAQIAEVYQGLSPEDQAQACIFTGNYGEAGAIWFFGEQHGLPKPISGHNQYFLWGPRDCTGEVVIAFGVRQHFLEQAFHQVEQQAVFEHPYVMPYENKRPIFVSRHPKAPMEDLWPLTKHFN